MRKKTLLLLVCILMASIFVFSACGNESVDGSKHTADLNIVMADIYSQPLAQVSVTLSTAGGKTAKTDNNGLVTFKDLPVGTYMATAQKDGYAAMIFDVTVDYQIADNIVVAETNTRAISLPKLGASVTGKAVYTDNGISKIAADAEVKLVLMSGYFRDRLYSATTDANGIYTFTDIPEAADFVVAAEEITKDGVKYQASERSGYTTIAGSTVSMPNFSYNSVSGQFVVEATTINLAADNSDIVINFSLPVKAGLLTDSDITVSSNPSMSNLLVKKTWSNGNKTLTISPLSGTWGANTRYITVSLTYANIKSTSGIVLDYYSSQIRAYLPEKAVEFPLAPTEINLTDDSNMHLEIGQGAILKIEWDIIVGTQYKIYCRNMKDPNYTLLDGSFSSDVLISFDISAHGVISAEAFEKGERLEVLVYAVVNGVTSVTPAKLIIQYQPAPPAAE